MRHLQRKKKPKKKLPLLSMQDLKEKADMWNQQPRVSDVTMTDIIPNVHIAGNLLEITT